MVIELRPEERKNTLPEGVRYLRPGVPDCVSAVIAYLMYEIDAPERLWQPSAIDEITDRNEQEETKNISPGILALLDNGAEIVTVRDFDEDLYIAEGLSYLQMYHAGGWIKEDPESFYEWATEANIAEDVRACIEYRERTRPFGEKVKNILSEPAISDITDFVNLGYTVMCCIEARGRASHQVAVTQLLDESIQIDGMDAPVLNDRPDLKELERLDEQITSAKERYERYEAMPTNYRAILHTPPIIGLLGILPALIILKLADYAGFSSVVRLSLGVAFYLIMTTLFSLFVRNKLRKNPDSKWKYLQSLY